MHSIINQQFYNTAQQARYVTANMQQYLDEYKTKPTNPDYAEKKEKEIFARQKQINTLLAFIITAEASVTDLLEKMEQEYKRGFIAGQHRERKDKEKPTPMEREAIRSYHNINQYHKWTDHF